MISLQDIGELELIKRVELLVQQAQDKKVVLPLGDDCAVVKVGNKFLLISSDMSVEDVHFLSDKFPPTAIGWKVMASAWSDIASMGGEPRWALVSMALPKRISVQKVERIYEGMMEATKFVNAVIVGGDTTTSYDDKIVIDVTVIGEAIHKKYITRSGAKPGDILAVTGTLGNSSAGLVALQKDLPETFLWRSQWYPVPRIQEGKWLCTKANVSAMIDISDGLLTDAEHIAEMSGVGINIHKQKIPISEELSIFCKEHNLSIDNFILGGGEEYQLLVTVPQEKWKKIQNKFNKKFSCGITEIGYVTKEWQGVRVDGVVPSIKGYEHFR
ncbi:MAG TPA: thiamine-phosphate kinase [Candidatus Hydrogenedens sp.]|nr:thiamine-phosphate kinase [Candidatus Hydrogenedens sp.]